MAHSTDKSVQKTRFAIADLQKRIGVLEATREDLERQIRKLHSLSDDLRIAMDALDSFERVKARRLALKAEKAMARRAG